MLCVQHLLLLHQQLALAEGGGRVERTALRLPLSWRTLLLKRQTAGPHHRTAQEEEEQEGVVDVVVAAAVSPPPPPPHPRPRQCPPGVLS